MYSTDSISSLVLSPLAYFSGGSVWESEDAVGPQQEILKTAKNKYCHF